MNLPNGKCLWCGSLLPSNGSHTCTNAPRSVSIPHIHHPGTSCREQNPAGQCGCPQGQCARGVPGDGDYYSEEAADIAESKARNAGVEGKQCT